LIHKTLRRFFRVKKRISYIPGDQRKVQDSSDVQLRGIHLSGNKEDLPSLIFFPDMFDNVENWIQFFMHEKNSILDERNVYLLYPRNFGNSDHCDFYGPEYGKHLATDVERFMYENKIGSATLGGHGLGAKQALLMSCYNDQYVTGFFALDYSPTDYQYFEFAHAQRQFLEALSKLDLTKVSRQEVNQVLLEKV